MNHNNHTKGCANIIRIHSSSVQGFLLQSHMIMSCLLGMLCPESSKGADIKEIRHKQKGK